MGAKQSSQAPRGRTYSESQGHTSTSSNGQPGTSNGQSHAQYRSSRTRSMTNIPGRGAVAVDMDTDSSGDELTSRLANLRLPHSLPVHLFAAFQQGIKCPVCNKPIPSDDIECHLVICLTKPKINYNEDVLQENAEKECVICFEDLVQGEIIARLPCLCIYHKNCIDAWFKRSRSCPEHPLD